MISKRVKDIKKSLENLEHWTVDDDRLLGRDKPFHLHHKSTYSLDYKPNFSCNMWICNGVFFLDDKSSKGRMNPIEQCYLWPTVRRAVKKLKKIRDKTEIYVPPSWGFKGTNDEQIAAIRATRGR